MVQYMDRGCHKSEATNRCGTYPHRAGAAAPLLRGIALRVARSTQYRGRFLGDLGGPSLGPDYDLGDAFWCCRAVAESRFADRSDRLAALAVPRGHLRRGVVPPAAVLVGNGTIDRGAALVPAAKGRSLLDRDGVACRFFAARRFGLGC